MPCMNRNLVLLALCQGLFLTNNVTFIAINGLVGLALAPEAWMATLPVTAYVVGGALSTMPVARLQARWGRQRSFQLGLLVAALTATACALAVSARAFWPLVATTLAAGFYSANASLYRFAGPELAAPAFKERAISLVLAGGIVGAFIGPNLANATRTLLQVGVDQAAAADTAVSTLMGEDVEARKNFIQTNAKDVRFLDI